jgi:hypothetical protein
MPNNAARISMKEILGPGRRYVSNPAAFAGFMSGLSLRPSLLLDKRMQRPSDAARRFAFFGAFMHEILPAAYDVRHLEKLGGRFCLRLTGVGDYTVIALNRRVVTLKGLPSDATGAKIVDAEMRADAFAALCNDLVAELSQSTLKMLEAGAAPAGAT